MNESKQATQITKKDGDTDYSFAVIQLKVVAASRLDRIPKQRSVLQLTPIYSVTTAITDFFHSQASIGAAYSCAIILSRAIFLFKTPVLRLTIQTL